MDEEKGKLIFWRRMAPKLKKMDDNDKYLALKAKLKKKKEEQAQKKNNPKPVVVTKAPKAKPLGKTAKKMKETLDGFADKRKKKPLRTHVVQGDPTEITSGRNGATPLLHREGLACAVEVHSTRGSREGEPPPRRLPP